MRAAVFFLMVPFLAALSIVWYRSGRAATASFALFLVMSLPSSLTASFIAFLRRALKTYLRTLPRWAFFAEDVFAMCRRYYTLWAEVSSRSYQVSGKQWYGL